MSVCRAFDLTFLSSLRVGAGSAEEGVAAAGYPSDTLSAALVVAAGELFGADVRGRPLSDVAKAPPWAVSSLLPWVRLAGGKVRFVPLPAGSSAGNEEKTLRKIAYVSTEWLDRNWPRAGTAKTFVSACGMLAHTTSEIENVRWIGRAARPSVTVDRVTAASHLFHLEELWIGEARPAVAEPVAGAWFAVRTERERDIDLVRALFEHLADSGIGADRARGLGRFRFSIQADSGLRVDDVARPRRTRLLLGCASPDAVLQEALREERARYSVVQRAGRAHGARGGLGLPRKTLRLLAAGAVIPDRGPVVGTTRDVSPDGFTEHPIFRDGRTLAWVLPGREA